MNNFQIQQSLLYSRICTDNKPFDAYTFYRHGDAIRTMYFSKKHFEEIFPTIRDRLARVHWDAFKHSSTMFDTRVSYNTFVEEYRKDCINAVHAEIKCVTRNIDSEPCIMSYVKQRKTLPKVQDLMCKINDLQCSLYRELMIRLAGHKRWCEPSLIEEEENVFLSVIENQEYWILEEREITGIIGEMTPFEEPEWRPKHHHYFTDNTKNTMQTLLLGIRRSQQSNVLPKLDPIVLEEAFAKMRYSVEDHSDSEE
jgi:hypothetical protein